MQLSWFDQFQFAGYYMAKENGYYEAAGLDVEILPYELDMDIPGAVEAGKADFAIGRESLIIDHAKGKPLVALYALFQASPLVLLAKESSDIKSVSDFRDKRIMIASTDIDQASLKAILASHHISSNDYTVLKHTHDIGSLVRDETDVISAYLSKTPYDLYKAGIPFRVFYPSDYGFDLYSDFLFTSQKYIEKNLETVYAFKQASLKGWEYAYENTDQSIKLIQKKYNSQNLSTDALKYEAEVMHSLSYRGTDSLGKIDKNKLQRIYDLYNVMGLLPVLRGVDSFVLNQFGVLSSEEKEYLENKGTITVCSAPDWVPHEYIENGKLVGISAAYLDRFKSLMGLNFAYLRSNSWEESLEKALNHQCDILTVAAKTPSRSKFLNFTSPYFHAPFVIATKNETPFIADLNDVASLPIGYVKGYAIPEILKKHYPNINLVEVYSIKDGLEKVAKDKLFGFIDSLSTINYILQRDFQESLKIAGRVEGGYVLSFGIRSDEPLLTTIIEKALSTIDMQTRQALSNQWSNVQVRTRFDYSLMWKILAGFVLLSLVGFWRYRMIKLHNKQIQDYLNIIDEYVVMSRADPEGNITYVSQALCRISGYSKGELIGKPHSIFRHPQTPPEVFEKMWATIQSGNNWHGELKNLRKDKTPYWIDAHISPIFGKNKEIEGYSAFQYDITDKKQMEQLSRTDSLTQIANRLHLENTYKDIFQLAKRHEDAYAMCIIDVDHFKIVNSTFGHSIGDSVLAEMAGLLKSSLRQTDILGRWEGEKFMIIFPQTSKGEASLVAEKIRTRLQKFSFPGYKIRLTCSVGVSQYESDDEESNQILERAYKALHEAKEKGRNRVVMG